MLEVPSGLPIAVIFSAAVPLLLPFQQNSLLKCGVSQWSCLARGNEEPLASASRYRRKPALARKKCFTALSFGVAFFTSSTRLCVIQSSVVSNVVHIAATTHLSAS